VRDALRGLPVKIDEDWQTEEDGWRRRGTPELTGFLEKAIGHRPKHVGDREAVERFLERRQVSACLGTVHETEVVARFRDLEPGQKDEVSKAVRLDPNGFCPTLRAGTGPDRGSYQAVRPVHYGEPRVITPREAARLQGFPDWFVFHPTKWHSFRQIGNSVSPIVAEHLLRKCRVECGF
jgi:DNA (cytosine-5)-methyltransferase 1